MIQTYTKLTNQVPTSSNINYIKQKTSQKGTYDRITARTVSVSDQLHFIKFIDRAYLQQTLCPQANGPF